jgi:hypothetical protein
LNLGAVDQLGMRRAKRAVKSANVSALLALGKSFIL